MDFYKSQTTVYTACLLNLYGMLSSQVSWLQCIFINMGLLNDLVAYCPSFPKKSVISLSQYVLSSAEAKHHMYLLGTC